MEARPIRRPRIADVAREAGVSKSAVSFAFNSPERLSPGTAARIRDVATTLGYRPHPVARMLTAGQTSTLGILSPQSLAQAFANPFFPLFAEGVATVAEDRGLALLFISPLHGSLERAMHRATVDGVVIVGLQETHPEVEAIRRAGLPVVVVDAPAWPEHAAVAVDDEGGARAAAGHLTGLGHREFLVIGVDPPSAAVEAFEAVSRRRLSGCREVLRDAGIELDHERVVVAAATFDGGESAFLRAWDGGLRPTAVLAMSDAAAAGVLQAARRLQLQVPRDLSVVGFDDLPLTRFTDPPLTTVHQPVRRKGEDAARLLIEALTPVDTSAAADGSGTGATNGGDGVSRTRSRHLLLETRLVVRGSTAPPRGGRSQEVVPAD